MILTQSTKFICYALWKIIFKVSYLWNVLILRWKSFPILRIGINNLSDNKLLRRSHFFSDYARAVSLLFFFCVFLFTIDLYFVPSQEYAKQHFFVWLPDNLKRLVCCQNCESWTQTGNFISHMPHSCI